MDMNGLTISAWIADLGIWPLVVVLVPNLMFRKYGQGASKKRMSSLFQAIAVFLITTVAAFVVERQLSDKYLLAGIAVVIVVLVIFREKVFPYRLTCVECDDKLDLKTIYFMDDNLCVSCHSKKVDEEAAAAEAAEEKVAEEVVDEVVEEVSELENSSGDENDKE